MHRTEKEHSADGYGIDTVEIAFTISACDAFPAINAPYALRYCMREELDRP